VSVILPVAGVVRERCEHSDAAVLADHVVVAGRLPRLIDFELWVTQKDAATAPVSPLSASIIPPSAAAIFGLASTRNLKLSSIVTWWSPSPIA
jgi:hypothetical protein